MARRAFSAITATAALLLAAPPAFGAQQKLTASDGVGSDNFGFSVAVEGNVMAVGASGDDANKGAVYVFERSGDTWAQTGKLTASDGQGSDGGSDFGDFFGTSVAIQGATIVVGAPGWDADDSNGIYRSQGAVYTFSTTGAAARTETARLTSSLPVTAASGGRLGFAVDIDGGYIAAGAPGRELDYIFASGGGNRNELRHFEPPGTATSNADGNGASVDIEGDVLASGAPGAIIEGDVGEGAAFVYDADDGTLKGTFTAAAGASEHYLGESVALAGDSLVAGAPGAANGKGTVYTFDATVPGAPVARTETAKLTASDGEAEDELGTSVATEGDSIFGGAVGAGTDGSGAIYRFAVSGGNRKENGELNDRIDPTSFEELGSSVAVSGDTIVAGAPYDQIGNQTLQGSVSVFTGPIDSEAPKTKMLDGPKSPFKKDKATFKFRGSDDTTADEDLTFECRVKGEWDFEECSSPQSYFGAPKGTWTFEVRAIDEAGNADRSPAKWEWKQK